MVRHIVSWNFKPELTEQQRKELAVQVVEQLNALQGQIPGLVHIQRPVIDLVFNELTAVDSAERRTRKEKIIPCGNGQERFVVRVVRFCALVLFHIEIRVFFFVGIFK